MVAASSLLLLLLRAATAGGDTGARTGGVYMGRNVARPYTDRAWLLRGAREVEEPPEVLLHLLQAAGALEPGSTVAELGSGPCFLAWRWAAAVGRGGGSMLAIDTDKSALADCYAAAAEHGVAPGMLVPVVAPTTPDGPPGPRWLGLHGDGPRLDAVLLLDTYHELASPFESIQAILATLRAGALLAILEYKDSATHILPSHRMRQPQLLKELGRFPPSQLFLRSCDSSSLRYQYLCVFQVPGDAVQDGDSTRRGGVAEEL